ncbi:MAG TPA: FecR domain-containing protein [Rhodoferax sp.]|jgi:hypothetical protein|nr:FecR domain-containing protein [Rhodoferax sp.]HNV58781.1 FecR domain-containing protein [Rhodoferax sp.]HPW29378.1 FecR domain-containing protein [Rhodoferax sp.]
MAPIDINDWWLAAAAAAATGLGAPSATAATEVGTQVGVVTSMRAGVVSATNERVVYIGNSVAYGERFRTDGSGIIHILFMDQSSMTLGPNSELVIDEFVFHPKEQRGNIAVNLLKGSLRVVGGFISKLTSPKGTNSSLVRTATATIGIRGGISLVDAQANQTGATFLFGEHMDVLSPDGQTGPRVTRPGFSVIALSTGIGAPFRQSAAEMANLVSRFESRQGNRPASGGNLISTNDRPNSLNAPRTSLAPDRGQRVSTEIQSQTPGQSLRDVMGNTTAQIQS